MKRIRWRQRRLRSLDGVGEGVMIGCCFFGASGLGGC
jgi:hypothetical protein